MSAAQNLVIARAWLRAFNARDLVALMGLYDPAATHTSPKLRLAHPDSAGRIEGTVALESWWRGAFDRLPTLRYEELALTADDARALLEYMRHVEGDPPLPVAEVFDVRGGKIIASRVYHG